MKQAGALKQCALYTRQKYERLQEHSTFFISNYRQIIFFLKNENTTFYSKKVKYLLGA